MCLMAGMAIAVEQIRTVDAAIEMQNQAGGQ
jgi:hypothetical protein